MPHINLIHINQNRMTVMTIQGLHMKQINLFLNPMNTFLKKNYN